MDLSPNSLAFIALSNEYCFAVENIGQSDSSSAFVAAMVRILPRIYIAASDLKPEPLLEEDEAYIESYLDEDYYESIRRQIENLLGPDDVYLEVFEEDMKYSETPIGMSLSEGLSVISIQVMMEKWNSLIIKSQKYVDFKGKFTYWFLQ